MKVLLIIIAFFISFNGIAQNKTGPILAYNDRGIIPIQNNFDVTMNGSFSSSSELITDCFTSLGVIEQNGCVYINWNSCDDFSNDTIFLYKSHGLNDTSLVDYTVNIPVHNMIILYSLKDKNFTQQSTFYNLYRKLINGDKHLIVTIFVPILENNQNELFLTKE